ncbi:MAG TPA: hypothetical protein VLI67_09235, partial [Vicinamibacteria bacterium]|nr:hypothetical protein [Vicinamibacteria bacterium]
MTRAAWLASISAVLGVLGALGGHRAACGEDGRRASGPLPGVRAIVLGIAQDGGVPHIGCREERCEAARRD